VTIITEFWLKEREIFPLAIYCVVSNCVDKYLSRDILSLFACKIGYEARLIPNSEPQEINRDVTAGSRLLMNNGKIWSPRARRRRRRREWIIQPEFSGLRVIPLDSFDVFSSTLGSLSFLPYFIPSIVRVTVWCKFAPIASNRLEISNRYRDN